MTHEDGGGETTSGSNGSEAVQSESLLHRPAGILWHAFTEHVIRRDYVGEKMPESSSLKGKMNKTSSRKYEGPSKSAVLGLIELLGRGCLKDRREAADFLREQSRECMESRKAVVDAGGLPIIVGLMNTTDDIILEDTVTALHNLSLSDELHSFLVTADVVEALIRALEFGNTRAKSNGAATIFNLSKVPENREFISGHQNLYRPLVELLSVENLRGKKDAAHAMCYLTLTSQGRKKLVEAGALPVLVEILRLVVDSDSSVEGMEEKVTAVLSNLTKSSDSRVALVSEGAIDVLSDLIQMGSSFRAREDAVGALLRLACHDQKTFGLVTNAGLLPDLRQMLHNEVISEKGRKNTRQLIEMLQSKNVEKESAQETNSSFAGEFMRSWNLR